MSLDSPEHIPAREAWAEANLDGWRRDSNSPWGGARCILPNHQGGDKKPSMRLNLETGGVRCLGCKWQGVITAYAEECNLPTDGLPQPPEKKDTTDDKPKKKKTYNLGKEIDWYPYYAPQPDGSFKQVFRVVRYEPKDFRIQRWDDASQSYKMGRKTKDAEGNEHDLALVPYNLNHIAKAPPYNPIIWVEGEKDANNCQKHLGLCATTTPHGASNYHHVDRRSLEAFRDRWVVLVADNDPSGRDYILEVARSLHGITSLTCILTLPGLEAKGDLSDWLDANRKGAKEAFQALLDGPTCEDYQFDRPDHQPRPRILVGARELHEVTEEAVIALKDWNKPPVLFCRGGQVVRIQYDQEGHHQIDSISPEGLLGYLSESAHWKRKTEQGYQSTYPDKDVSRDIVLRRPDALPPLLEICHSPVYDKTMRLIRTSGYDTKAGIYLDCPAIKLPRTIPTSDAAVTAARKLILDEMLGDFPFVDESSRANCVATILVPFVRRLLGPTPMHIFDAPSAGTGKGLLASIVSIPSTGKSPPIFTASHDNTEFKKQITSKLVALPIYIMIDEVQSCLYSDVLASVLTSDIWEDRILGKTKVISVPNRACWLAAGNNPQVKRDIARRTVWIRLDRKMANPWTYTQFKRPNIVGWCTQNRDQLLLACLTLVQAWVDGGRPEGDTIIGSFELYSKIIGGILKVAGINGFLLNHEINAQRSDSNSEEWEQFILAWYTQYGGAKVEVKELSDLVGREELLGSIVTNHHPSGRLVALGKRLQSQVDRIWPCGLAIRIAVMKNEKGKRLYKLEKLEFASPDLPTDPVEIQEAVASAGKLIL